MDTNLNGVFDDDEDQNQMRIFRYQKSEGRYSREDDLGKDCLRRDFLGNYEIYDNTCGRTIPLKRVKLFLKSN